MEAGGEAGGEAAARPAAEQLGHRVKVYELSILGSWEDKGTGHVWWGGASGGTLSVRCEEASADLLLRHQVDPGVDYTKQGDTIVTWSEPGTGTEVALSFQETAGCAAVWDQIVAAQTADDLGHRGAGSSGGGGAGGDGFGSFGGANGGGGGGGGSSFDAGGMALAAAAAAPLEPEEPLPFPDLSTLDDIIARLEDLDVERREALMMAVMHERWLDKLCELFSQVEDLERADALCKLFAIFKSLVLLNAGALLEELVEPARLGAVIGALEYDPDSPAPVRHRETLARSRMCQVVPLNSADVADKVRQNYHLTFLKDAVLLRHIDDPTLNTINSIIFFNNVQIVSHFTTESECFDALFTALRSGREEDAPAWELLRELVSVAKTLQPVSRTEFYSRCCAAGLLELVEQALAPDPAERMWLTCVDVLANFAELEHAMLQARLVEQRDEGGGLLGVLFSKVANDDTDPGLSTQLVELLRGALDLGVGGVGGGGGGGGGMGAVVSERRDAAVLSRHVMEHHAPRLVTVLMRPPRSLARRRHNAQYHCTELATFLVSAHGATAQRFMLTHGVPRLVAALVPEGSTDLRLAAIRYLRACVGESSEPYDRYIVEHHLLDTVMDAFAANGARYNMLNSSVIDLVEFCRADNRQLLVWHIVTHHGSKVRDVQYVDTFRELRALHAQNERTAGPPTVRSAQLPPGAATAVGRPDLEQEEGTGVGGGGGGGGGGEADDDADNERESAYFSELAEGEAAGGGGGEAAAAKARPGFVERSEVVGGAAAAEAANGGEEWPPRAHGGGAEGSEGEAGGAKGGGSASGIHMRWSKGGKRGKAKMAPSSSCSPSSPSTPPAAAGAAGAADADAAIPWANGAESLLSDERPFAPPGGSPPTATSPKRSRSLSPPPPGSPTAASVVQMARSPGSPSSVKSARRLMRSPPTAASAAASAEQRAASDPDTPRPGHLNPESAPDTELSLPTSPAAAAGARSEVRQLWKAQAAAASPPSSPSAAVSAAAAAGASSSPPPPPPPPRSPPPPPPPPPPSSASSPSPPRAAHAGQRRSSPASEHDGYGGGEGADSAEGSPRKRQRRVASAPAAGQPSPTS